MPDTIDNSGADNCFFWHQEHLVLDGAASGIYRYNFVHMFPSFPFMIKGKEDFLKAKALVFDIFFLPIFTPFSLAKKGERCYCLFSNCEVFDMAYGLLYDYLMGQSIDGFRYFGAHFGTCTLPSSDGGKTPGATLHGVWFRLYAPLASDVSVIGEWNNWDVRANKMNKIDEAGVWETFVPNLHDYQSYKYHFKNCRGEYVDKADPFAFYSELRPQSCSRTYDIEGFPWNDQKWMNERDRNFDKPMSIYELHLGSLTKKSRRILSPTLKVSVSPT